MRSGARLSDRLSAADRKNYGCALAGCDRSSFAVNMVFVMVSRTALVTMPIMLAVFGCCT